MMVLAKGLPSSPPWELGFRVSALVKGRPIRVGCVYKNIYFTERSSFAKQSYIYKKRNIDCEWVDKKIIVRLMNGNCKMVAVRCVKKEKTCWMVIPLMKFLEHAKKDQHPGYGEQLGVHHSHWKEIPINNLESWRNMTMERMEEMVEEIENTDYDLRQYEEE